jgi:hypothetical protein
VQWQVTIDALKAAADDACFAVLDRNDASDEVHTPATPYPYAQPFTCTLASAEAQHTSHLPTPFRLQVWRKVFLVRKASAPAHFKLLNEKREMIDEPEEGCPNGIISDSNTDHCVFAEWGMYYKGPSILRQPANPFEAARMHARIAATPPVAVAVEVAEVEVEVAPVPVPTAPAVPATPATVPAAHKAAPAPVPAPTPARNALMAFAAML